MNANLIKKAKTTKLRVDDYSINWNSLTVELFCYVNPKSTLNTGYIEKQIPLKSLIEYVDENYDYSCLSDYEEYQNSHSICFDLAEILNKIEGRTFDPLLESFTGIQNNIQSIMNDIKIREELQTPSIV